MNTTKRRALRIGSAVVALAAAVGLSTAAQADHVGQIAATDGSTKANYCIVGAESFTIPGEENGFFGVTLTTTSIKKEVRRGDRTLAWTCTFTGVPTFLDAYDPAGPEEQPGTNPYISADYRVPAGGFTAGIYCWDRFNEGLVEARGTITVTHRGTATLKCDLTAAYAEHDAQSTP